MDDLHCPGCGYPCHTTLSGACDWCKSNAAALAAKDAEIARLKTAYVGAKAFSNRMIALDESHALLARAEKAEAALAAKDAEIAALKAELADGSFYKEADIDALMDRAEKAEAEIARLRGVRERDDMLLARAGYRAGHEDAERGIVAHDPRVILSRARAALTGEKGNG